MIISREVVTLIHTTTNTIGIPETELYGTLSDDEKERTRAMRFPADKTRFIFRRGLLRRLLGTTLDIDPALIRFSRTPVGKPFIDLPENPGLFFNLSHSDNQIVYAFSSHSDTGIDIERIRIVDDIDRLARNYFSAEEYAVIINLPDREKHKVFIKIWSIKEALIKACGCPLEHGLAAFDVAAQYRMNRFQVPFGNSRHLTCITPLFERLCGYATVLAIYPDNNDPLILRRYTLQNSQYIEE
ncbi:MAG: 4'-phosphopantetheinyl transferase superfamily protein [Chlorobiaceae bacterium]|nr:4'-phosphopantetheinyl transferase superfamily protein [Chlorobiaceae bacterium]